MDEITIVLLGSLIIFFAFYTRALFGFGGALISIPLLAFLLDLKIAVPMEAIFEVILSLMLISHEYKKVKWKIILPLIIGSFVGTLIGTYFLKSFATETLQKSLGVLIIIFSLNLIRKPIQQTKIFSSFVAVISGIIAGVLGAMFGTSGPPIVLFLSYQIKEKEILRATLIGVFTLDFAMRIVVFLASGVYTTEVIKYTLYLTPALILGTILGSFSFFKLKVSPQDYKKFIAVILILSGILLILK